MTLQELRMLPPRTRELLTSNPQKKREESQPGALHATAPLRSCSKWAPPRTRGWEAQTTSSHARTVLLIAIGLSPSLILSCISAGFF